MAYTPTVWKNGEFPPIDAEHLNKIEQGIANSAPGGYGLGEPPKYIADANDAVNNGWYAITMSTLNLPNGTEHEWDYTYLRVDVGYRPDVYIKQTVTSQYRELRQCEITRCKILGVWQPWEWVNPPMILGTEYRTTERYLGKPVYCKVVNCGNLPGNAVKITNFEQVNVIDEVVSVTGHCTDAGGVRFTLPAHFGSAPNWDTVVLIDASAGGSIQITSFSTAVATYKDTYITVKYTKLAD